MFEDIRFINVNVTPHNETFSNLENARRIIQNKNTSKYQMYDIEDDAPEYTMYDIEDDEPVATNIASSTSVTNTVPESNSSTSNFNAKNNSVPAISKKGGSERYNDFVSNFNKSKVNQNRFALFSKIAEHESQYNHTIQNTAGAPAYGYFQFMQGTNGKTSWNNISKFANTDIDTFRNDPVLQIQAADRLADSFLKSIPQDVKEKAYSMGYNDNALIGASWLAGAGGVTAYFRKGENRSDGKWYGDSKKGSSVKSALDRYNI